MMTRYKAILVEDEKHQLSSLTRLLGEVAPDLEIIGTAASIPDALVLLASTRPDLVFLDVMLPPDTSFDLLEKLSAIPFDIIFTTSFEQFALKAFRLSAVDYLLKPVVKEELVAALEKFRQKKASQQNHIENLVENMRAPNKGSIKVALPTLTGYLFIKINEIVRCESDNTYTTFFTLDKKKIVVSKTLKDCEQLLVDYGFYRVHNSHLINLDYVTEYTKGEGGTVRLADGSHIDVSRRRKDDFLKLLKNL